MAGDSSPHHAPVLQQQAHELLALAEKDRRAAELAFEKLGFEGQLQTALVLSGDKLHEWLMLSSDFTALVRALPPEHLHLAVRLIGAEDAVNLLQAASSEQMQQMLDIEWFTENKLDRKKVRRWIELLLQLKEDECDEALRGVDVNALAEFLRRAVKITVDRDNLLLALHLNQRYLLTPDDLEAHDELIRDFLNFLYSVDRDLFAEVVSLLVGEEEEIVAADMYAGREDRLLKRGFPALAEAEFLLELINASQYGVQWPGRQGLQPQVPASTALEAAQRSEAPFLLHALAWGRSSGAIGERTEREFIRESASLANSLLLAHTKDTGDPSARADALLAVQVLSSVGLEAMSHGNLQLALEQIKALELRELFRLGWSLTREVARDAWALATDERISSSRLGRNLAWLAPELREAVCAAEDLMSWRRIAGTAKGQPEAAEEQFRQCELLTWPRLCRLRWLVWRAAELLGERSGEGREQE